MIEGNLIKLALFLLPTALHYYTLALLTGLSWQAFIFLLAGCSLSIPSETAPLFVSQ